MIGKNPANGVSTTAYAMRVQPKPPNGIREYAYSISTQQQAVAIAHQSNPPDRVVAEPSRPKNSDMKMIRTTATQVPRTCTQLIARASIARPKRYPRPRATSGRTPRQPTVHPK